MQGNPWTVSHHGFGLFTSPEYQAMRSYADVSQQLIEKAFTTGSGVVQPLATGGQVLRQQFMPKVLQQVSFEQDDAGLMKRIKKKKVPNNTIEWSDYLSYGTNGDGFVGEAGFDGQFGVQGSDDNFQRQIQFVKYMGIQRTVSLVSTLIQGQIESPMKVSEKGAMLALISQMNLAAYNADSTLSNNQFNGIRAQIIQWVDQHPEDRAIIYDAGGNPLSKDMMEDIMELQRRKWARIRLALMTIAARGDATRLLYPAARYGEGGGLNRFGINPKTFESTQGDVEMVDDAMLLPNDAIVADGPGSDGKPRTASTVSVGSIDWATTPWVSCAATTPGTASFWNNVQRNTTGALSTKPAHPAFTDGGNNGNRLQPANYYYAVAPVWAGREGLPWVYGSVTNGDLTGATAITVTTGNSLVQMVFDTAATPCITGLGSTYARNLITFRVYRYGGPGVTSAPTAWSQFDLLCTCGVGTSGDTYVYDNGMYMPGSEVAYFLTETKNGADGFFMAELLPILKRPLPHLAMADLFCLLAFITPILWIPKHHIWVRNIGRAAR